MCRPFGHQQQTPPVDRKGLNRFREAEILHTQPHRC